MDRIKTETIEEMTTPKGKRSGDGSQISDSFDFEEGENPKSVLIVDDLGVITYQLGVMFRNLGYDVAIAKEIYDGISKYKERPYKYNCA